MSIIQINIDDKIIQNFFNKQLKDRNDTEIKHISKYLSHNYAYFMNLKSTKDFNPQKIEKIIKYGKLELIPANTIIFKYGEPGNKFYILLKGSVTLFKPDYKEVYLTPYQFYQKLKQVKEVDLDELKYERIIEKNVHVLGNEIVKTKDLSFLGENKFFYNSSKKNFFWEKMEKVGIFKDGFAFGEMALIKRTTRNATILTNTQSLFLTIGKKDYNIAIRELHDRILNKDIEKFIKDFPIFQHFSKEIILEILNNLSRKTIYKGEYLFKQGEESSNIYFLKNGSFNISFNFSFAWFDDYLKYFNDINGNMIIYLLNNKQVTFSQLIVEIEKKTKELHDKYNLKFDDNDSYNYKMWEKCTEKVNRDNFLGIKMQEEKLNDENKVFNINIKEIKEQDMLGFEDAIECRRRFCSAKCISEHADLLIIKVQHLIRICRLLRQNQLYDFLCFMVKRKDIFIFQILNKVKNLEKDIIFSFNHKYDMLKGEENETQKETDIARMISILKLKGFKTNINELLDKEIDISDYVKSSAACKSFNFHLINRTPKEAINRNKLNMKLLNKIDNDDKKQQHMLKLKNSINNLINESNISIWNNNLKFFNNIKNKKRKAFMTPFSQNSTSISHKYKILSREKTYDNYKNFSNRINLSSKNDFSFNSYNLSNAKVTNDKLFKKIYPDINETKRKFAKEILKKIDSVFSSTMRESSCKNIETNEDDKSKIQKSDTNKNENKGNYFNKIYKNKILDLSIQKSRDILKSESTSKNINLKESLYYDKLRKENKDFYLGEKFNKKFLKEYHKIKPIHYQSFFLKSKG